MKQNKKQGFLPPKKEAQELKVILQVEASLRFKRPSQNKRGIRVSSIVGHSVPNTDTRPVSTQDDPLGWVL